MFDAPTSVPVSVKPTTCVVVELTGLYESLLPVALNVVAVGMLKVNVPGGEKRLPCAKAGATLTAATVAMPARMEVILFMLVFPVSRDSSSENSCALDASRSATEEDARLRPCLTVTLVAEY